MLQQGRHIRLAAAASLTFVVLAGQACAGDPSRSGPSPTSPQASLTVAGYLEQDARFDLFVRLVEEGTLGFFDIMAGPEFRNNTLFVPTDAAFEALGQDMIDLLIAEERERARIRLHIVPFPLPSEKFESRVYETAHGSGELTMEVEGAAVTVSGAQVIDTDIPVSNGTLHVIDKVLGIDEPQ